MKSKNQNILVRATESLASAVKAATLTWQGGLFRSSSSGLQSELSAKLFGGVSLSSVRLSTDSFFTLWRNHGDVFGCVRELSQAVGVAGYYWENATSPDADPNAESVKRAEAILSHYSTVRGWLRELVSDVNISGNSYYHLERSMGTGEVMSLARIDPRTMVAVVDKYGTVKRWVQKAGASVVEFQPEEIVHFVIQVDPNSPCYGISPMEPIVWELRTDLAAMVSNYTIFQNDATPSAIYVFSDEMNDDEQAKAVETLKRELKGAENRHKQISVKGLTDIKSVSISNKDMEFTFLRTMTTEKVCAAYGVPKSILGYTDDVNLANGEEQTKKFWESSVEPQEEAIREFINRVLLPAIGITDIKWCFETRDFDNREWDESSTRADMQLGIYTINEMREMRGKEPYDPKKYSELVDTPLIFAGLAVRPVEDIGFDITSDPLSAIVDEPSAEKALQKLDHLGNAYEQRKAQRKAGKPSGGAADQE